MPAFATHEIFGEEVLKEIPERRVRQAVLRHRNVFHIGCQGPDLFFYNPFFHRFAGQSLGSRMHEEGAGRFFASFLESLLKQRDRESTEIGISYLLGFLSHYVLDTSLHPYIYGSIDYRPGEAGAGKRTIGLHHRMEAALDREMLMTRRHKMPASYHPAEKTVCSLSEKKCLADLLCQAVPRSFPVRLRRGQVEASFWFMDRFMQIVYGRRPWVRKRLRRLEEGLLGRAFLSNLMVDDKVQAGWDVANRRRGLWTSPWEPERERRESVWQLYDAGAKKYGEYYQALCPVLTSLLQRITMLEMFPGERLDWMERRIREQIREGAGRLENRSYHSGKPLSESVVQKKWSRKRMDEERKR